MFVYVCASVCGEVCVCVERSVYVCVPVCVERCCRGVIVPRVYAYGGADARGVRSVEERRKFHSSSGDFS